MYSLANLLKWKDRSFDLSDENDWLDLLDDFGPALPRFLLDGSSVASIPEGDGALAELRQSLVKHPISSLKPEVGSVWILFAFKDDLESLPRPFRKDGILLPFEWRIAEERHSEFLPEGLVQLAERVKGQFGDEAADCTLHPSSHFLDAVDFHIPGATFDSAWGALATGLDVLLSGKKHLTAWPFSTIAYDFGADEPKAVGGLEQKFLLAASAGAEEIAVAPAQYREAKRSLLALQAKCPENKALRQLRVYHWKISGDIIRSIAEISKCNQPKFRKRILFCAVSLLMFVLPCLTGYAYWLDWEMEKISYYGDYVERNGVVEGRFPLGKEAAAARGRVYRFHYQGYDSFNPWTRKRVLRAMWCVNGNGAVRVDQNDYPEHPPVTGLRYRYDASGRVSEVEHCVAGGHVCNVVRYSGDNAEIADVIWIDGQRIASGSLRFSSADDGDAVRRIEYIRNVDGYATNVVFRRDSSGVAALDGNGISRLALELRTDGRVAELRYQNWQGSPVADTNGVHIQRFTYENEFLRRIQYLDLDEKPVNNGEQEDERRYSYSAQGNLLSIEKMQGGRLLQQLTYEHDSAGDVIRESRFSPEGVARTISWSSRCVGRDDMGNVVRETFFGQDGEKWKRSDKRIATIVRKFTASGNPSEEAFYDENGSLMAGADGWAKRKLKLERLQNGYAVRRWYYGENDLPVILPGHGIAGDRKSFDLMGRLVEWELFGIDDVRVDSTHRWHRQVIEYGRDGKTAAVRFYDKADNMIKTIKTKK